MFAYFALAAAMTLTGINVALGKVIVAEMPPASFAMLRFVLASACLVPLALQETAGIRSLQGLNKGQWIEIVALSLFGVVGFTTLMLIGIQYTSAINAGIIASVLPAIIALLSWLVLKEFVSARKAISIALAVLGIGLINLTGPEQTASNRGWLETLLGNSLILAAVTSEAIFAIITRRYANRIPPWTLTMIVHLIAIPLTLPIVLLQDGGWVLPQTDTTFWLIAVYYIITSSVLSFYLWCLGIKTVPASTSALFTALVPTSALLIAVFFLDERLVILQIFGLLAVFSSLLLGLRSRK